MGGIRLRNVAVTGADGDARDPVRRRYMLASQHGGTGKTTLAVGAAALLALRGERVGYLGIGARPDLIARLNPECRRPMPSPCEATIELVDFSDPESGAQFAIAEVRLAALAEPSHIPADTRQGLHQLLQEPATWFIDWQFPPDLYTGDGFEVPDEIWILERIAGDPHTGASPRWPKESRVRTVFMDWVASDQLIVESDAIVSDTTAERLTLRHGTPVLVNGVPQVLAEPYSQNALAITSFVRGKWIHER